MSDTENAAAAHYGALSSPEAITKALASVGYIANADIAMVIYLAINLRKPVLIEGPAGVGKTDLAQSLGRCLDVPVERLQCYEGLDESKALYEWQYGKQLLYTQVLKDRLDDIVGQGRSISELTSKLSTFEDLFYSHQFLEPRPLLRAMEQDAGSVLLVDEIDKSDEEFEAFLLEVLSDYQVTVPELGTIKANVPPIVILTSNNIRELGDALKRRCLHLFIDFPDAERERQIVKARVPGVEDDLLKQLVAFVQDLRDKDLKKRPSISETVDWARTLVLLHASSLDESIVRQTLTVLLKHESDISSVSTGLGQMVRKAANASDDSRLPSGYPNLS